MNREIEFRGYNQEKEKWVYGCLVNNMWTFNLPSPRKGMNVCEIITGDYKGDCWEDAVEEDDCIMEVVPESVGQFTGHKDKNGKKIYEGDIVVVTRSERGEDRIHKYNPIIIDWKDDLPGFSMISKLQEGDREYVFEYDIIGNIYENTELITTLKTK